MSAVQLTTSAELKDIDPGRFLIAQDVHERKSDLPDDGREALERGLGSVQEPDAVTTDDVQELLR